MNWAVLSLLTISLAPTDYGWDVADPPPCVEVLTYGFPTTPIVLVVQPAAFNTTEVNTLNAAVSWWNSRGLGVLFCYGCAPSFINTVYVYPEISAEHAWNHVRSAQCLLLQSQIVIPRTGQAPDLFAEYVHMLGHALGLREDTVGESVMNLAVCNTTSLNDGSTHITDQDFDLLYYMQIF